MITKVQQVEGLLGNRDQLEVLNVYLYSCSMTLTYSVFPSTAAENGAFTSHGAFFPSLHVRLMLALCFILLDDVFVAGLSCSSSAICL